VIEIGLIEIAASARILPPDRAMICLASGESMSYSTPAYRSSVFSRHDHDVDVLVARAHALVGLAGADAGV
jgi:hypothetical protein